MGASGVYAGRDPLTGKKVWKSRTFRGTKPEVERALAAFVTEKPSAQPVTQSRTFDELLERWFLASPAPRSPSTTEQTRWIVNGNLKGLADRKVAAMASRTSTGSTQRCVSAADGVAGHWPVRRWPALHTVVRLALGQAVVWGWRADNPAERARPGR